MHGTGEFPSSPLTPFFLAGLGYGGAAVAHYLSHYAAPGCRAGLLLNGFCYLDPNLSSILHDCINVFSCSPASRPDLPVYFYRCTAARTHARTHRQAHTHTHTLPPPYSPL